MLAERDLAHLVIIDIQERLAPAIHLRETVEENAARLVRYAAPLGVPVTFTEQMPERIGATVPALQEFAPPNSPTFAKTAFSIWRDHAIRERVVELRHKNRSQIILAGMEAHVCVLQSALELLANDFEVFVVADAIGSRAPDNHRLGLERMSKAGAEIVSHEMIAFEWLEKAGTAEFKALLPLLKT